MLNGDALKVIAIIFGLIMLIVGVLGFVPAVTSDGMLLGIFHVNALHNYIHIATGLVALLCGLVGSYAARHFFQIFGIIYGLVGLLGLFYGDESLFGVVANNFADAILHLGIAAFSLWLGFSKACHKCCRMDGDKKCGDSSDTITNSYNLNGDKNIHKHE